MPVYEYECTDCGQVEEAFQKISESPLAICSQCKGHLKKLISQSSFHLKGSGWYVTDYAGTKNGGSKNGAKVKDETKEESVTKPTNETKATSGKASTTSKKN
jgi:putative FmdB family regulatory protein